MINKFGNVMIYVNNPREVANFWIENVDFTEVNVVEMGGKLIGVEVSPYENSDTNITLFDKEWVKANSPAVYLDPPSLLFKTYDIKSMNEKMKANGVAVSEVMEMGGMITFNFPDPEGNYFAVQEVSK